MSDPRITINSNNKGHMHTCIVDRVPMRGDPGMRIGKHDSELLYGELFAVYDVKDGIAYGQNQTDQYVGYVPMAALQAETFEATHVVAGASAFLFEEPTMKSTILGRLSLGSKLNQMGQDENGYIPVWPRGWTPKNLLQQAGYKESDPVFVAEKLLGVPYQWGGRSSYGIDCSGLTQIAYERCGIAIPRDTDMQEQIGAEAHMDAIRRGDLLFALGHVVMVVDKDTIIHANASLHHATVIEPLADARRRYDFRMARRILS